PEVTCVGVAGHDAVLDAVVTHLHEMAGAAGPTVQIAVLGRAADPLASRQSRRRIPAGRQRGEDRIEMLDHRLVAADHQTIPAFQSPDAAARPATDVVHAAGSEDPGP